MGQDVPDQRFYSMIDFLIEEKNKLRYSGLAAVIVEMALLKLCDPDSLVKNRGAGAAGKIGGSAGAAGRRGPGNAAETGAGSAPACGITR